MNEDLALTRLLQLASPALPVGAYSYSQGLESAVESGVVATAAGAERWIADMLRHSMARLEAPLWWRLHAAWAAADAARVRECNECFLVTRETAELRAETAQMGYSLVRLLGDMADEGEGLDRSALRSLTSQGEVAFPTAFTFASVQWRIPPRQALNAYLWSWLENQVMAAVKAVPLGQTEGQRLLARLGAQIVISLDTITATDIREMSNYCHGLAISSSRHETQYSRLFRS
ncbi:MAG: urease accessory protein UreF [Betaproteobacteria bacterium]|nr:urease accessory protein UreF [Betaproteobacteria bacterium]